jgi:hypothetical protein
MFYGFYPAVCTIGGEEKPGYANWKRYFSSPEQYERDRDLFRKYIPVIRRLNLAGWEPVTQASTSQADTVLIERFGHWSDGELFFTLRNTKAERQNVTVRVEALALGVPPTGSARLVATDVLSGQALPLRRSENDGTVEFDAALAVHDTTVVQLSARAGNGENSTIHGGHKPIREQK